MFWIYADHPYHTLTVDDLALVTHLLHGSAYFHNIPVLWSKPKSFIPVSNSSPIEVVWRKFYQHPISRKYSNKMLAHLS